MSHVSIEHCSKSEKQEGCMGREWLLSLSAVYPPDTWFTATAQHHSRVLYGISPAWEKVKIQSVVSKEYVSFLHHGIVKIVKLNHCKPETDCLYSEN